MLHVLSAAQTRFDVRVEATDMYCCSVQLVSPKHTLSDVTPPQTGIVQRCKMRPACIDCWNHC
jgi:hypothetical protein